MNNGYSLARMLGGLGLGEFHRKYLVHPNDLTRSVAAYDSVDDPTVVLNQIKQSQRPRALVLVGIGLLVVGGWILSASGGDEFQKRASSQFQAETKSLDVRAIQTACQAEPGTMYLKCFLPQLQTVLGKGKLSSKSLPALLPKGASVIAVDLKATSMNPAIASVNHDFRLLHLDMTLLGYLKAQNADPKDIELMADVGQLLLERIQSKITHLPPGAERNGFAAQISTYSADFQNRWAGLRSPKGPSKERKGLLAQLH